jgi:hypothetical protein
VDEVALLVVAVEVPVDDSSAICFHADSPADFAGLFLHL